MYYSVQHVTTFHYSAPITESMMEVRAQPRSEGLQRCLSFQLKTSPRGQINQYRDYLGNAVYHFDIPGKHQRLAVVAEAIVEIRPFPALPDHLSEDTWVALDAQTGSGELFDFLVPSDLAQPTALLHQLAAELKIERRGDPLSLLRELNRAIYDTFDYVQDVTDVRSPIDVALSARQGVCQDYAHVMIALVRELGIPCRYISGYLFHRSGNRSAADASHAWVEAWLPDLGWIGFDPTNNLICGERHIRVAVGRDYADVPPTRGVFKGRADTRLEVAVKVTEAEDLPTMDILQPEAYATQEIRYVEPVDQQEQQQQQQ